MARSRQSPPSSKRSPRRHTRRRGRGSEIICSVLAGLAVGGIVMVMGFINIGEPLASSKPRHLRNSSSLYSTNYPSSSSVDSIMSRISAITSGGNRAEISRLLPLMFSSSDLPKGLERDAASYQRGQCNTECKSNLKSALHKALGPNWRSYVERYRNLVPVVPLSSR